MVFNYILVKNPKMAQFCRSIFQHHWTMVRIWASHERYFAVWLQTFATPLNGRSAIRHGRCQVAMTWAVTGVAMGWNGLPYVAMGRFSAFEKSGVGKMRKNMRSFAEIQWISMNQWSIYQWCVFNLDHLFPPICQFFFHHLSHGDPPAVPFRTAFRTAHRFFSVTDWWLWSPTAFPNTGAHQCLTSGVCQNGAGSGEMVMEWWKFMEIPDQERFGPRLFHWSHFLRHVMIMIIYDKYPLVI